MRPAAIGVGPGVDRVPQDLEDRQQIWAPPLQVAAVRPVATIDMVRSKLKVAVLSALLTWLIVFAAVGLWVVVDLSPLNVRPSIVNY